MTAQTLTGGSVDATPDPEFTFERELGALYAGYVLQSNTAEIVAAFACDRTHPAGGGLKYKLCNAGSLTAGEWYYLVIMQECDSTNPISPCAAGMALSQDMHGNPIATSLTGWTEDDFNAIYGGAAKGFNVLYYELQVQY